jgi:hypothetical protein
MGANAALVETSTPSSAGRRRSASSASARGRGRATTDDVEEDTHRVERVERVECVERVGAGRGAHAVIESTDE